MQRISSKAGTRKGYDRIERLVTLNNYPNDNKGHVIFGNPDRELR